MSQIVREKIGADRKLILDANQVWEVPEAIASMERLASKRARSRSVRSTRVDSPA